MSAEEPGSQPQAVNIDDIDESTVPTAPMKAVTASDADATPAKPMNRPPIDFDDDDDEDFRPGTRDNPYTSTCHEPIGLDEEVSRQIKLRPSGGKPNMVMVLVRVLVILGVLGGAAFGLKKLYLG